MKTKRTITPAQLAAARENVKAAQAASTKERRCPIVLALKIGDYACVVDGNARIVADMKPEPPRVKSARRAGCS